MFAAALVVAVAAAVGADANPAPAWPGDPDGTFASCGQKSIDITAGDPSEATGVVFQYDQPMGPSTTSTSIGCPSWTAVKRVGRSKVM